MNYVETLIAVADDCPVHASVVPAGRGGEPTVAAIQHELLAGSPHALTQEDVLFEVWLGRQRLQRKPSVAERRELRARLFSKPQACLRSSPLPKRYGWGLLFDREGRVALCAMESQEYQRLVQGAPGGPRVLKALRSKRA